MRIVNIDKDLAIPEAQTWSENAFSCNVNDQTPSPKGEGTEVSKMAIREGTVFWGVSPPL